MTTRISYLLLIAALGGLKRDGRAATAAAGDNAAPFRIFCDVLKAAQTPIPTYQPKVDYSNIKTDAEALNMSLHHNAEIGELTAEGVTQASNLKEGGPAAQLVKNGDFKTLQTMAQAAKKLQESTLYGKTTTKPHNTALIVQIVNTIRAIKETADALQTKVNQAKTDSVQQHLFSAIYGGKTADDSIKLAPGAPVNNRGTSCGKGGSDNDKSRAGTSLKHDVMCLCAKGNAGASGQACSSKPELSIDGSGDKDLAEDWKKLKGYCRPSANATELTAATLASAAAGARTAIATSIGSNSRYTHFLGKVNGNGDGGCDATTVDDSNKGACIYYGRGTGGNLHYQIEWATQLTEAATALSKAEKAATAAELLENKLKQLNETVATLAMAAALPPTANTQGSNAPQLKETPTKSAEELCNAKNADAKACNATKGCHYDASKTEGPRCTLQPEVKAQLEKANQETGGADGKIDCKKHDNKKDCEAENEGLAANAPRKCGWIDYVDGTGKLPKPECRSSSFLVNKKFALSVVSAAFVALLF
uniref:Variant surface glycoprotein 1125.122 n=1 Tax=Trypanosoma brucei TaxID=5691 RepID=A0A1J0R467_9TRYP|nr:variant surface glycoprotein 1125.122 [Trypanosoma brucei]